MTQQLTDLTERGALTQHLGRQSMTKLMGSVGGRGYFGALERVSDNGSHTTGALKTAKRRFGTQE
jgi:hypothetical protein